MSEEQKTVVLFRRRRALFWDQIYGGEPWPTPANAEPEHTEAELYRGMFE
jgi:hypothetical protein